ncbi:MAG: hypothetical protein F6J93_17395 [Oscillatoria sp. SIO1A7]|nr:hypothetical protein [Oscillatoria sp. SIO1A7]
MNVSLKSFATGQVPLRNSLGARPSLKEGRERMRVCQWSRRQDRERVKITLSAQRKNWQNEFQEPLNCSTRGIAKSRRLKNLYSRRVRKNPFGSLLALSLSCLNSLASLPRAYEELPRLAVGVTRERAR